MTARLLISFSMVVSLVLPPRGCSMFQKMTENAGARLVRGRPDAAQLGRDRAVGVARHQHDEVAAARGGLRVAECSVVGTRKVRPLDFVSGHRADFQLDGAERANVDDLAINRS